jgi:hypothetical protein
VLSLGSTKRSSPTIFANAVKAVARSSAVSAFLWSRAAAKTADVATAFIIAASSAGSTFTRRLRLVAVLDASAMTTSPIPSDAASTEFTHGCRMVATSGGSPAVSTSVPIHCTSRTSGQAGCVPRAEEINLYLGEVCESYGTVNATAEALKASPDRPDQEVAGHLEWYLGYVGEERAAGRMG